MPSKRTREHDDATDDGHQGDQGRHHQPPINKDVLGVSNKSLHVRLQNSEFAHTHHKSFARSGAWYMYTNGVCVHYGTPEGLGEGYGYALRVACELRSNSVSCFV